MDSLLNTAPCGFLTFTDDGTMTEVNATLADLLGYTRVELEGWHLQKVLPPGGRVFYHTHIFPLLKLHGRAEEIYVALRAKDGSDVPMMLNGVRRERDGVLVNDCVFVRMQQRHRFEDELLLARRAAEQANAARAKFLSMMSHDLRTPLTAVTGFAKLMQGGAYGPITEEQRDVLLRMNDACRELLRMINDILSFAQLESGRVEVRAEPVRLADAIARAESLIRVRVEERGLTLSSDCDGAVVLADPDKLQQILLNLLTNAIKFTASGGAISVSCSGDRERLRIHVRDTGIGIPAGQLDRVFDAFVQLDQQPADQSQRGVGLGLAISRDLSRAMEGELTVESVEGEGSVFTVELPRA
ncbi:MAG TPA: PAS domain-containing sensor histidine kinase [Thermoanaerobaculia bacterium]|nr:PAS domain-containing sensor histidine kinase [Thermoanaerobaculia bacterium]